jgi:hypothetical protein
MRLSLINPVLHKLADQVECMNKDLRDFYKGVEDGSKQLPFMYGASTKSRGMLSGPSRTYA